jgi:site-specific DNA-methyltransferase (adenine-specific)
MKETNYNPDVLSCLANLSNDEVFTPPSLVNEMLNLLPKEVWENKDLTFLDPVSKSGVFLREIAKRLIIGLEKEIPDKQKRINHIFTKQLFGIAITELTSLLSRRSIYCSKFANGKYSICDGFKTEEGNIAYTRLEHTWQNGKCKLCGASKEVYDREDALETYAYPFIHIDITKKIFKNMKFDVIIGNPPYQLSDGGFDKSASPIYHKFVLQAKKLNPRFLTMIIPARWYSGGKGLDDFRKDMLNDNRISAINDFPETSDCFPGLNIRGGVSYFLWDREYKGDCEITTYKSGVAGVKVKRPLLENGSNVFVRYNEAISILRKVQIFKENSFQSLVSSRKPFGLSTNFSAYSKNKTPQKDILLYRFGDNSFVSLNQIEKNANWVKEYKVLVPKASPGSDIYPHQVLGLPILSEPNSCCTETYIIIGPFANKKVANNVISYLRTSFLRFLVILIKNTQDVPRGVYGFVPLQDFNEPLTDEILYKKYNITEAEQEFINTLIRPMKKDNEK